MVSQRQHFARCPLRPPQRVEADWETAMGRPQKVWLTACRLCLLSTWKTSYVEVVWTMGIMSALFINPDGPLPEETCSYCVDEV